MLPSTAQLINTRWKVLPEAQRNGIKNFVINYVLKVGSDENLLRTQKGFINKVNLILVQVRLAFPPLHRVAVS